MFKRYSLYVLVGLLLALANFVFADEYQSANFKILDPAFTESGGEMTSASFKVVGSLGQVAIGTSTSAAFGDKAGFYYYPEPTPTPSTTPTPTPTPAPILGGIISDILRKFVKPEPLPPGIPSPCPYPQTDLNCDGKIDLQDLSIFLYFEPKPSPNPADFNADEKVNLRDMSLLFFDWTGKVITYSSEDQSIFDPMDKFVSAGKSFFERLFGQGEPAAVAVSGESDEGAEISSRGLAGSVTQAIKRVFVGFMGTVFLVLDWIYGLF